nr:olfactory receptor 1L1-like [Podarcis muralis]
MEERVVPNWTVVAPNQTSVTEFILVGLSNDPGTQLVLFVVFLVVYLLTLAGNILIVVTIIHNQGLHTPMYFFLSNLSFIDVCHATVTVPKMLADFLSTAKTISFGGCVAQMFFLHLFACTEIFLLTVMAYDRYVAICNPMHYLTIMNQKVCLLLAGTIWLGGTVHSLALTGMTIKLPYCGPQKVDNFFCDVPPVIRLACTDTYVIEILIVSNSGLISVVCFVVLVVSYGIILVSLRKRLAEGRRKALSTCAAHLTVVTLFLGHCIFIYSRPSTSFSEDKVVSVFFTAVTPLLNPIIYTLRNEDMKQALNKLFGRKVTVEKKTPFGHLHQHQLSQLSREIMPVYLWLNPASATKMDAVPENVTTVKTFVLSGLTTSHSTELALFVFFTAIYSLILVGNVLIVVTIIYDQHLHTPMYFFLSNLSFIDVCHSSVVMPKMLADFLAETKTISFGECIAQMFFLHLFACTEIFLLTIMAYDRYAAICNPLHYGTIMSRRVCLQLAVAMWLGGLLHSIALTLLTLNVPYCGPNNIDNFFCDVPLVIKLACANTYVFEILIVSNSGVISVVCFVVLVVSYVVILVSLRNRFSEGRRKALSTCAAHLTVVTLFLGHCIFIYLRPAKSLAADKVVSIFFTAVTPLLNPVIYTLRNEDMLNALNKLRGRQVNLEGKGH